MFLNECRTRTACTFVATAQSADRQWVAAAAGDVDGDGRRDLIAFARGAAHVDVLLGTATRGTFNDARIVAPGAVEAVRVGDFDGNALTDVAFVASTADRDTDALYVAFGRGNAAPAAPTYMGYLGNLLAFDRFSAAIPGRQDAVDDLVLASERGGTRGAAPLFGATSQRLVSSGADGSLIERTTSPVPFDPAQFELLARGGPRSRPPRRRRR